MIQTLGSVAWTQLQLWQHRQLLLPGGGDTAQALQPRCPKPGATQAPTAPPQELPGVGRMSLGAQACALAWGGEGTLLQARGSPSSPKQGDPGLQHCTDTLLHARQPAASTDGANVKTPFLKLNASF